MFLFVSYCCTLYLVCPESNNRLLVDARDREVVAECEAERDALLQKVRAMSLPPNFLDDIIDKLGGTQAVAEMTGAHASHFSLAAL